MKKNYKYLAFIISAAFLCACNQDGQYQMYESESFIQFGPDISLTYLPSRIFNDTLKTYTFIYDPETVTKVDVFFDIYALGGPQDRDRPFVLRQINIDGVLNAIPGKNYVAFDSEEMKDHYVIPAGEVHTLVPIRIMRTQGDDVYTLQFELVRNDEFAPGDTKLIWRRIEFTSTLQKPASWDIWESYFGIYSRVKHEFMIEVSGYRWDEEFIVKFHSDSSLRSYWQSVLTLAINELNAARAEMGLDKLRDENNLIISFP